MKNIKNIIFDFGGVLLNIDYHLTEAAFRKLGFSDFDILYSQQRQSDLFDRLEKGEISENEFIDSIKKFGPEKVREEDIRMAWNAMLLDFPDEVTDVLNCLRGVCRVFLLSNTNQLHKASFMKIIEKKMGWKNFETFFEKTYLSCDIGMRKPDSEVFERVIFENKLKKEETLFIDDSIQHVEGALRAGLRAIHLNKNNSLKKIVSEAIPGLQIT